MKTLSFILCSTVVTLCVGVGSASAQYVSPRSPARNRAIAPLAPALPPSPTPGAAHRWVVTNPRDGGPGTLRDAINRAAAGDTVIFALRCPSSIVLTNTLFISQDISVLGPGPDRLTVTRGAGTNTPGFRIFEVDSGTVVLAGMTIQNGVATQFGDTGDLLGGGIYNFGALTVSNCVVTGNVAPSTPDGTPFANAGRGFGGGIYTDEGGSFTILNSTISGNQATSAGGGVNVFHAASFVVEGSSISGNFAVFQGGGVNYQGVAGIMQNSTVSGNSTPANGSGSGLLNICFEAEASSLTLTACTIAQNFGSSYGAVQIAALASNTGLTNQLLSTLVGSNSSPNFFLDGNPVLVSLGHNLDSDGTSSLINGVNGDQVGGDGTIIDPVISPLQDNGGPTFTHALLPRSPALGAGACTDATGAALAIDQRGFPRPATTGCDIGAFENQAPRLFCSGDHHHDCDKFHRSASDHPFAVVDDPDGDALTVIWSVNGSPVQTNAVAATHPPHPSFVRLDAPLGAGTNVITATASDGKAPAVTCSSTVVIRDTTPPKIIAVLARPSFLSPPDHRMVPVTVTVTAIDASGPVTSKIVSISSNQPVGGTSPDWVITGDLTALLRAETTGHGARRVYTITVQCSDPSGNTSTGTTQVIVPGFRD